MSSENQYTRIMVYYDGHFFYKVTQYYLHKKQVSISIRGLHDYLKQEILSKMNKDPALCKVESNYFIGKSETSSFQRQKLEHTFLLGDVKANYLPLKNNRNFGYKEEGIDVLLALEAYKTMQNFDIFVLFSGDGDYVPLVKELQKNNIFVVSVYSDFEYTDRKNELQRTRASQLLLETVNQRIDLEQVSNERVHDNPCAKDIWTEEENFTKPPLPGQVLGAGLSVPAAGAAAQVPAGAPYSGAASGEEGYKRPAPPSNVYTFDDFSNAADAQAAEAAFLAEEHESVVLNVVRNGGWVSAREFNNFHFFASDLVNLEFEALREGMKVRFYLEKETKPNPAGRFQLYKIKSGTLRAVL